MRPQTDSTLERIWWAIQDSRTKVKWMIFTVLIPEYIIGKALSELLAVNETIKNNGRIERPVQHQWDKVTASMANMGYFIIDFEDYWLEASSDEMDRKVEVKPGRLAEEDSPTVATGPGYSLKKKVTEILKSNHHSASTRLNLSRLTHRYWALSSEQMSRLFPRILDPPVIPVRQLEVLNRGDTLVKALALVQITYLIVQLIARKVAGMPSAQLEIGALAFSASSIITYGLYWNRPQGVQSTYVLTPKCAPSAATVLEIAQMGPIYLWTNFRSEHKVEGLYDVVPIPNDGLPCLLRFPISSFSSHSIGSNTEITVMTVGAFFGGTLFGGLHCLAWNFHFPTQGEALAWRVFSILTSVLPLLAVVPLVIWKRWHPWAVKPKKSPASRFALGLATIFGLLIPYVLARLFLIIEMFRSLFFLPPEAFIDTWSGSFPHWE
jgi:hypothetical protein